VRAAILAIGSTGLLGGAAWILAGTTALVAGLFLTPNLQDAFGWVFALSVLGSEAAALHFSGRAFRQRDRTAVITAGAAILLAVLASIGAWWMGAMHGVLVTMDLEGVSATELPPLDMYVNPNDYVMFDDAGEEVMLDLGALPEVLRLAGWSTVVLLGWLPASLAIGGFTRAAEWFKPR
jgi:hypothetical protein